jgi:hypothetical protein
MTPPTLKLATHRPAGTPDEGPADHVANALQLLVAVIILSPEKHGSVAVPAADLDAIMRRLETALRQLRGTP